MHAYVSAGSKSTVQLLRFDCQPLGGWLFVGMGGVELQKNIVLLTLKVQVVFRYIGKSYLGKHLNRDGRQNLLL